MPVLPLVGSTIVPPGRRAPLASAASTMRTAIRSFTDPPGLKYSTLASTSGAFGPSSRVTAFSRTSGVLPTRSTTDSAYCTGSSSTRAGSGARPPHPIRWAMSSGPPARRRDMSVEDTVVTEGHAPVNGMQMYWGSQGAGGTPLVLVHGGFGGADMMAPLAERLAGGRRVISVELQGHGHTADVDRPFGYEAFGDDLAALVRHLDLGPVDLLGYSLGGGSSLRAAIQHPEVLRRLVLVSVPCRRTGWFPEVLAGMDQISRAGFPMMSLTPLYERYAAVAPDVAAFPVLMDKTGDLLRRTYDWSEDVRTVAVPTLLVYADADSVPTAHAAEFFGLLGGGLRDAGWDGAGRPRGGLAILPGRTHYDVFEAPQLADVAAAFLPPPAP